MMRLAYCSCRQLTLTAKGEPVKVSICHCRECQRRTGSAFGVAVFYGAGQVTAAGNHKAFLRRGESGKELEFRFCPCCGSTVYWLPEFRPNLVAIALGCFEDPSGIEPTQSVYEAMQFPWVSLCLRSEGSH
ncbi:GFA family protein [Agrobacterium sp. CMT1]